MKRHWPVGAEVSEAAFERRPDAIRHPAHEQFLGRVLRARILAQARRHRRHGARPRHHVVHPRRRFELRAAPLPARRPRWQKFQRTATGGAARPETRSFAEWYLTYHLHRAGLPVPAPIAARYVRHGLFYRADLITQRIENSESLAQRAAARGRCRSRSGSPSAAASGAFTTPACITRISTRTTSC